MSVIPEFEIGNLDTSSLLLFMRATFPKIAETARFRNNFQSNLEDTVALFRKDFASPARFEQNSKFIAIIPKAHSNEIERGEGSRKRYIVAQSSICQITEMAAVIFSTSEHHQLLPRHDAAIAE